MYRIEYLNTPALDETRMSMWGFNIRLSTEFMEKVEALDMSNMSEYQPRFRKRVSSEIICRLWNPDLYKHESHVSFLNNSPLLHTWSVPGNCACMGNDPDSLAQRHRLFVEYNPHNVDSMKQAMGLLQIFIMWFNDMYYLTDAHEELLVRRKNTM